VCKEQSITNGNGAKPAEAGSASKS
jgi:hypothetical protein